MSKQLDYETVRKEVEALLREYTGNQAAAKTRYDTGAISSGEYLEIYARNKSAKKAIQTLWGRVCLMTN